MSPAQPRVSFVIPVKNDAARLRRCLETINANRYTPGIEAVVVDNGSTDDSVRVARAAGARILSLPSQSVAELRNRGAQVATGDVLVFVDADHEIVEDWVACAVETLRHGRNVGAVGAMCMAPEKGNWVQRTYDLLRRRSNAIHDVEWLGSGNMAVLRRAFELVGGFDTRLQTCEDVDLCRRLRRHGFRIVNDPRLRNVHLGDPASLRDLFRGELWRGRDNLRVSLRAPFAWRDLPSIVIPIADVMLVAVAMVALGTRSTMGVAMAILSAGAIAGASALRAARMVRQSEQLTPLGCAQAFAVAAVYDAARAMALVRPGGHEARRKQSA
jgi:glycosyltransferase involved in cell wall biosynthesis